MAYLIEALMNKQCKQTEGENLLHVQYSSIDKHKASNILFTKSAVSNESEYSVLI